MGGYGSGRPATRATIGGCGSYRLTTGTLRELLRAEHGGTARLTFEVQDERMTVAVEVRPAEGWVRLRHPSRARGGGDMAYRVPLVATPCGFGGRRWWFVCPLSHRRCVVLRLPRGGPVFASAPAYRLAYDVASLDREGRLWRKMAKIARRLGDDDPAPYRLPPRPKGMRRATYERLADAWCGVEDQREAILEAKTVAFLARLTGPRRV